MIFTEKRWDGGYLVVCGSLWPGADQGAPMPDGYPDRWRTDQRDVSAVEGTRQEGLINVEE